MKSSAATLCRTNCSSCECKKPLGARHVLYQTNPTLSCRTLFRSHTCKTVIRFRLADKTLKFIGSFVYNWIKLVSSNVQTGPPFYGIYNYGHVSQYRRRKVYTILSIYPSSPDQFIYPCSSLLVVGRVRHRAHRFRRTKTLFRTGFRKTVQQEDLSRGVFL